MVAILPLINTSGFKEFLLVNLSFVIYWSIDIIIHYYCWNFAYEFPFWNHSLNLWTRISTICMPSWQNWVQQQRYKWKCQQENASRWNCERNNMAPMRQRNCMSLSRNSAKDSKEDAWLIVLYPILFTNYFTSVPWYGFSTYTVPIDTLVAMPPEHLLG